MQYMGFVNLTPYAAQPLLLSDERGADVFTFVVKATYGLRQKREWSPLELADEQVPPCLAPEYAGDPESSSLKYDSDAVTVKPATDVALIAHALAPHGRAAQVDVSLTVGPVRRVLRVFGNRVWTRSVAGWTPSPPAAFEAMPLVYERAFGGWDRSHPDPTQHAYEPRNPVGVGFVAKSHGTLNEGDPLPNIENPAEPIGSRTDRPAPVGFGLIGHQWHPRAHYGGTYDEHWQEHRMPLLPEDFDRRFYNAGSPSVAMTGLLRGGEPVEIVNVWPRGTLRFQLPQVQPLATARMKDGTTRREPMALDTVIINTDEDRLFLVWHASIPVYKRIHEILWAKVQLAGNGGAAA